METREAVAANTKSSLIWNTIFPVIFQVYRFGISIVIARLLNPKDFGIMGMASLIIFYTNNLSEFGLSSAIIQRKEITEKHVDSVFVVNIFISILLSLATFLLSERLATFSGIPELEGVLMTLSVIFITTSFHVIPATLLKRELKFKVIALINAIKVLVQTTVTLTLVFLDFEYWALVYGLVASNVLTTIIIFFQVKWVPRLRYNHDALREVINFSSWNFLFAQIHLLTNYLDKLLIGKFLGPISLGFYDKAFSLAGMANENISSRLGGVMFSSFSRNQENRKELERHFSKAILLTSVLGFPVMFGLMAVAPYFVSVLLGNQWEPMTTSLQILLSGFVFNSLGSIIASLNVGAGQYKTHIKFRLCMLFITAVMCIYSVKAGINVIAVVIAISSCLTVVGTSHLAKQALAISWLRFFKMLAPALFGSSIMVLCVKLLAIFTLEDKNLANLTILVVTGVAVYVAVILLVDFKEIRFLRNEVSTRVAGIISEIRKKT